MKTRLSALAVTLAMLVGQQAANAQPPGYTMPAGYFAPGPGTNPQQKGGDQDPGCCGDPCSRATSACCDPWQVSVGSLYLRPRNAEVTFGVPTEADTLVGVTVPLQLGPMGVVDGRYDPGFTVGFGRALTECSSVGLTYSHFNGSSSAEMHVTDPQQIFPMVLHPSVLDTDPFYQDAVGQQNINFRILDAEFRSVFAAGCYYDLAFVGGARYVNLRQSASFGFFTTDGTGVGDETLFTHINFDGGGVRLGLEGERRAANSGLLLYGKTAASFVAGEFRADFLEARGNGVAAPATAIVDTSWRAGRVVSILDLELGAGWASPGGRLRLTGGYMVSGWFNVVKTADWIRAVQTNNLVGLSDTISFDGLVGRVELRF
jgi:hypothetical protein